MKFQFVLEEFCLFTVFIHTYFVLSVHKAKDTYTIPITYQYRYPFIPHTYLCHTYFAPLNHPHTCHVPVTTNTRHKRNKRARDTSDVPWCYHIHTNDVPNRYSSIPHIYHTALIPSSYLLCTPTMPISTTYSQCT